MPKHVRAAMVLVIAALLIATVDFLLQMIEVTRQDMPGSGLAEFALNVLITVALLVKMAKRRNWARWVFVVLIGLAVLAAIPIFLKEIGSDLLGSISTVMQALLYAVAVVLLLQRPARQWFTKAEAQGEQDRGWASSQTARDAASDEPPA